MKEKSQAGQSGRDLLLSSAGVVAPFHARVTGGGDLRC